MSIWNRSHTHTHVGHIDIGTLGEVRESGYHSYPLNPMDFNSHSLINKYETYKLLILGLNWFFFSNSSKFR